jgi:hypothetical protein
MRYIFLILFFSLSACFQNHNQKNIDLNSTQKKNGLLEEAYRIEDIAKNDSRYAGFIAEGSPANRVTFAFVGDAQAILRQMTNNPNIYPLSVKTSLNDLQLLQSKTESILNRNGIKFRVISIDVLKNDVLVSLESSNISNAKEVLQGLNVRIID